MRSAAAFGKNAGIGGAVGLLFPDGRKNQQKPSEANDLDLDAQYQAEMLRDAAAVPVGRTAMPGEHVKLQSPPRPAASLPKRKGSLNATAPSPTAILPPISASQGPGPSGQSPRSPPRSATAGPSTSGAKMDPSVEAFLAARRRAFRVKGAGAGAGGAAMAESGSDSELDTSGPLRTTKAAGGGGSFPPSSPNASSPAPSAYSRNRKQLARLSQQSSVTGSDASGDYATADDRSDADHASEASSRPVSTESQSAAAFACRPPAGDPFATIRRNKNRRGVLLTASDVNTLVKEQKALAALEGKMPRQNDGSPQAAAARLEAEDTDTALADFVSSPASVRSSRASRASRTSSTPSEFSQVNPSDDALETPKSGTFGYSGKAGRRRSGRHGVPRIPSVACSASSPFASGAPGPDIRVEVSPATSGSQEPATTADTLTITPSSSRSQSPSISPPSSSPESPKPARPPRSPCRSTPSPLRPRQAHSPQSPESPPSATSQSTSPSGRRPLPTPPAPGSNGASLSPLQAPSMVWSSPSPDHKRLSENTITSQTTPTPSWYYNNSATPRSVIGALGLVDHTNTNITSESAVSLAPSGPTVHGNNSDSKLPSSTMSNSALASMSTSSLNSARLATLRPPSLSAVTGITGRSASDAGSSWAKSKAKPRVVSRKRSASASTFSKSKLSPRMETHSICSDCDSESDCSTDDERDTSSPEPFDFTAPRPGFVPTPTDVFATWAPVESPPTVSTTAADTCFVAEGGPHEEEAQKRSLDVVSDASTPQMTHSIASHETTSTSFELQSVKTHSPADPTVGVPAIGVALAGSAIAEEVLVPGPTFLEKPPSQFARASFGCDGNEADRERAAILAAAAPIPPVPPIPTEFADSSSSEVDSDFSSDEECFYQPPRSRDGFLGSGSIASRHASKSHTSVHSIPANHREMAYDLRHLQSLVLPDSAARKSSTSIPYDELPSPVSMPRQKSLVNLMSRKSAQPRKPRRVRSSPKLQTKAVVDDNREFHPSNPPSQRRMWEAGTSFLYDEDGNVVCFGDLFPKAPRRASAAAADADDAESSDESDDGWPPGGHTVIFFIRSFWCGMCQDYTLASIARLDPVLLKQNNVRVAVIGPGHWKMLRPYRELFKCPFPFYTDPARTLYHTMGMIKYGTALKEFSRHRAAYHQASIPAQAAKGVARGLMHMPLGYNVGNLFQLGGEFVIGPGYRCEFAHRMRFFGDHMDAREVLQHAGVDHPEIQPVVLSEGERAAREELDREALAASRWVEERDRELNRMKEKKAARRIAGTSRVMLDEAELSPGDALDDARSERSEWTEYVQSVLNPDKRASYVFTPPVPLAANVFSPLPSSRSMPYFPREREREGGRIPVPAGDVPLPRVPLSRLLIEKPLPNDPESDRASRALSPKPPYRPLPSPMRKAVPQLSREEDELMRQETQRLSQVVAGLD